MQRPHLGATRDDRGTVTVFVTVLAFALVLAAGLVFDGGRVVDARLEAADAAGAAARAGAQQVVGVRAGNRRIDPARARAAALAHLRATGHSGTVDASLQQVRVTVRVTRQMTILSLAGVGPRTVTASRTARPANG
jgi:Flp pilus assembly protein TadG